MDMRWEQKTKCASGLRAGIYVSACIFCAYMSDSFRLYKRHTNITYKQKWLSLL